MGKKHTSYRISEEGKQCIQLLARLLGVRRDGREEEGGQI